VRLNANIAMLKRAAEHVPICSGKRVTNSAKWHDLSPFLCELGVKNSVFDAVLRAKMLVWGEKVHAMHADGCENSAFGF